MPQLYLSLYPKSNKSLNPKHLSNQASYFFHCYPSNSGLPHLFPRPTPETIHEWKGYQFWKPASLLTWVLIFILPTLCYMNLNN